MSIFKRVGSAGLLCLVLLGPALMPAPAKAEAKVPVSQGEITLSFAPLVRQAAPAVVNIYAKRVVETRVSPFSSDPFFREFFGDFGQTEPRVQNSLGSGVILSADGLVVSNYHVVGQATDIRVVLNDRREFSAEILLGDRESDLAVLQLNDAKDLPHLELRNSDTVEVGELVLAIGNPFGVGQTVSSGIVSGLARSGTATGNARGYFVQTDAPINPGNSGGALIDIQGQLIGINTSILTRSGGSNGIGFAIPSSLVAEFQRQAQQGFHRFIRPWAGLAGQPVDADIAESFGLGRAGGIVISDAHPLSPFAEAGIAAGDVITSVNGAPVNTPAEMLYRMSVAGIGGVANITRLRDGEEITLGVDMIPPPDEPPQERTVLGEADVLAGLEVARINPAVIAEVGVPLVDSGVVVIDPGPLGHRVGLGRGDIIQALNRDPVETPGDLQRLLQDAPRRVTLSVLRGNGRVSLSFRR